MVIATLLSERAEIKQISKHLAFECYVTGDAVDTKTGGSAAWRGVLA
jgi:hypothetical protein